MAQIKDYKINLQAGVEQQLNGINGYFWSITEVSLGSDIQLAFDNGPFVTRNEGMGGGGSFQDLKIKSAVAQTVIISVAIEKGAIITDQRATVNATVNTSIDVANTITSSADVSVPAAGSVLVSAARADRKYLAITNLDAVNSVRLNEVALGANQGTVLGPGETAYWPTTAAVYANNTAAAIVALGVVEMRFI